MNRTALTFEELLAWNHESAAFWKAHLDANPALLDLPCSIGGAATVQQVVGHIWGVELRWGQRIAGLPVQTKEQMPAGPLDALYDLHLKAVGIFRQLLDDPAQNWEETMELAYDWLPPQARFASRRKVLGHALFHSQRHWAQLSTQLRVAGFSADFKGDLLFSLGLA
jgi:uncharacterized damage-inducible protein DinB